jgi:hypothetical protein
MVSYASAKAEALRLEPPRGSMRRAERAFYLTLGAALTPLFARYAMAHGFAAAWLDAPMLLAVALVAVVANISAVSRLVKIAQLASARAHTDPAMESGPRLSQGAVDPTAPQDPNDGHDDAIRYIAR